MIAAKIVLDSYAPSGCRLTTFELTYPRFIHSELMTHRAFSRNAASSRAIPVEKMIKRVEDDPATFVWWGKNQKGMQAREELQGLERERAVAWWLRCAQQAVAQAREGVALGLHKQNVNRVLEPYAHMVTIVSATDWANFFFQRDAGDAQPEFQCLASKMRDVFDDSRPNPLGPGEWHMPYLRPEDRGEALQIIRGQFPGADTGWCVKQAVELLRKISTGRCARVSYLNQDGVRDLGDDVALHDRLVGLAESRVRPGHWSPLEHVAMALPLPERWGNFVGWKQYRKIFCGENRVTMPPNPRRS